MQIQENVLLAPLTTFGIGGEARFFTRARSVEDLKEAIAFARSKNLPFFALGGGSNVLVSDEGFAGLVIKIEIEGKEIEEKGDIIASAGENWDDLVASALQENLWGIENLSGIPGTLGGAIVQNIGAYGQAISEVVEWVEVFDTQTGEMKRMTVAECAFDYRDSFFKHDNGRHIVVRAALRLGVAAQPNLSYRDLKNHFADRLDIALPEIREAVLAIRAAKFPDFANEGTAGSFFKNPLVSKAEAEKIQAKYPEMPLFAMPETTAAKVPLAWLLDHELHLNGFRLGRVRLFERQPIVIAADRGATASDVSALAKKITQHVRDAFGIEIEEEVKRL